MSRKQLYLTIPIALAICFAWAWVHTFSLRVVDWRKCAEATTESTMVIVCSETSIGERK